MRQSFTFQSFSGFQLFPRQSKKGMIATERSQKNISLSLLLLKKASSMKTTLLASLLVLGCCSLIVAFPHEIVDDYFDDIQDFTMRSMTGQRAIKIQDFLTNFMASINITEYLFPLSNRLSSYSQAKYDTKLICLDDVVLEALGPGFANCPANDKQLTR